MGYGNWEYKSGRSFSAVVLTFGVLLGEVIDKSQQGYNHIETGRAELKIDDLVKLCRFYDISSDYIIGLIDKEKSYK